jgi:soluble lytic murein transglycosylase-like protein
MIKRTSGAVLLLSLCFGVNADVYRIVDEKGSVTFTNVPLKKIPKGTEYTLVLKSLIRRKQPSDPVRLASLGRNGKTFESIIESAAQRHNVDPKLLHAVIRAESGYNPKAVSHKGAVGLMQLMPQTADRYGVTDPEDPKQNINGGANYLSDLMDMFASDIRLAVAAYNAGEQNVIKYGNKIPPFKETQQYVTKVMGFYRRNF